MRGEIQNRRSSSYIRKRIIMANKGKCVGILKSEKSDYGESQMFP